MAPVQMISVLREMQSVAWASSPEVAFISLCAFLILSIAMLALCAQCRRQPTNAYDVNGSTTDTAVTVNGGKVVTDPESVNYSGWRTHKDMPANTLERNAAAPLP